MRRTHKYATIMGGRADAYTIKENNWRKKPKASIKSPAEKIQEVKACADRNG